MVRIFISFASADEEFAAKLHSALTEAGAEVFQFQRSAKAGQGAWNQVYDKIQAADHFICLISRDSLRSRAVKREIEYADYCFINYDGQPELMPVVLDDIASQKLPPSLRVLTPIDLSESHARGQMKSNVDLVVKAMGLAEPEVEPKPIRTRSPKPKTVKPRSSLLDIPEPAWRAQGELSKPEAEPSDAKFRSKLAAVYGGFPWAAVGYALTILVVGALLSLVAMLAVPMAAEFVANLIGDYRETIGVNLLWAAISWISQTVWAQWVSSLVFLACVWGTSILVLDGVIPLDFGEHLKATFFAAFWALILAVIWAIALNSAVSVGVLALASGAAVFFSAIVLAFFAVIDEF